jgi:hypothetical protein
MPIELHAQLITEARRQDVSVNHLMVALLAGGVGFRLEDSGANRGHERARRQ